MAANLSAGDIAQRKRLLSRFRLPLFLMMLFTGFWLTLHVLFFIYPDAGPGSILFFPVAMVAAFPIAIIAWLMYIGLSALKWWAGIPLLTLCTIATLYIAVQLVTAVPGVAAMGKPVCNVSGTLPADTHGCIVEVTVAPKTNPARDLFAAHGWTVDAGKALPDRVPERRSLLAQANAEFSRDIGLDFTADAGQAVQRLSFPVKGKTELPGPNGQPCRTRGIALVRADGTIIGAWVECTALTGGQSQAFPGYSLRGNNIESLIDTSWTWHRLINDW